MCTFAVRFDQEFQVFICVEEFDRMCCEEKDVGSALKIFCRTTQKQGIVQCTSLLF